MIPLGDTIANELAAPPGRDLQERLLQAMFMMERYRGIDAGWREVVAEVADADVRAAAINRLAEALRVFIRSHQQHPDIGSAIFALGALRAGEDAALFSAVLGADSGYGPHARAQAQCALEVIRQ
jgi:hypothetical protein